MSRKLWRRVMPAMVLAVPLYVPFGYWLVPVALCCLVLMAWRDDGPMPVSGEGLWCLPAVSCGLMLAGIFSVSLHGGFWAALPVLLAALLGAGFLPAMTVLRPRASWFWSGLGVTGLAAGLGAVWQRRWDGDGRAEGFYGVDEILYGDLTLLVGLCCLAGLAWARQVPHRSLWMMLMVAGAAGGVLASAFSGTRGGWLALPLAIWVFHLAYRQGASSHRRWVVAGVIASLLAAMVLWPASGVQQRLGEAIEETRDYLSGEVDGSVGKRMEMYRGAMILIVEAPLVGHGPAGYWPNMQRFMAEGRIAYWPKPKPHAHNDLLDAWVRYGLPGLLAVFALYLVPLWRFVPALRAGDPGRRALALAGTLIPVCYFAFGLSYSLFAYPVGVVSYLGSLALLWWLLGPDHSDSLSPH